MNRRSVLFALLLSALSLTAARRLAADASAASDSTALNTLTDSEKAAGWKLLFDGKTTKGWRNFGKKEINDKVWKVEDGVLVGRGSGGNDIITTEQYGAFELVLDYKISKRGNSGVMYHVTEAGNQPYETGPEVQIYDDHGEAGAQKTGFLYQLYGSDVDATKPAGEWNQMRLLITPEKCATWINGTKYYEYVIGSDDWKAKLAKGKFNQFPNFAKQNSGFICLQEHGGEVAFRNVKIRKIGEK